MKYKLLLLNTLFICFILTSCSNELDSNESNVIEEELVTKKKIEKLKKNYIQILNSENTLNLHYSVKLFSKKASTISPITDLNKRGILSALKEDLSLTDFENLDEMNLTFNKMVDDMQDVFEKNQFFYDELFSLDKLSFHEVLAIGYTDYSSKLEVGGPCFFACVNTAVDCGNTVDGHYENMMNAAGLMYQQGNFLAAAAASVYAQLYQYDGQHQCAVQFNYCSAGCE